MLGLKTAHRGHFTEEANTSRGKGSALNGEGVLAEAESQEEPPDSQSEGLSWNWAENLPERARVQPLGKPSLLQRCIQEVHGHLLLIGSQPSTILSAQLGE